MPPRDDDIHLPPEDERAGLRELHDPQPNPRRGLVLLVSAGAVVLGLGATALAAYTRPPAAPEAPPVLAAPAAPAKARPENPGGNVVRNQDLAVNTLMERSPSPPRTVADPAAGTAAAEVGSEIRLAGVSTSEPSPSALAAAASPSTTPPPPPAAAPPPRANPGAPAAQALRIVVTDPVAEPVQAPPPAPSAPQTPTAPNGPARAATAAVPSSVRVQIGAFRTDADAEAGWAQFVRKHPAMARDRNKLVTRATVNGTEWRRVQITGFADRTAAEAYCSALRPTGQACMVVGS